MEILYIILSLIFLGIIIYRPVWGGLIILATLPSYLLRWEIFGIPTTVLEINIVLWFVVTLYQIWQQKNWESWKNIFSHRLVLLFLIFIVFGFISIVAASDMRLALGAWKGWMLDPAMFLLTALYYYKNKNDSFYLIYASILTVGLVVIWGLVEYIGGFGMQLPGFLNAMFTSANYTALLLIPLWFLAFGLWLQNLSNNDFNNYFKQVGWIIFHLIVLAAIVLTKSYAGLLALGAGGLYILITLPKSFKYKKLFVSLAIIFVLLLAGFVFSSDKINNFKPTAVVDETVIVTSLPQVGSYNSLQTRQQIWTVTIDLIRNNLWLGVGFGNFEPEYYHRAFELYHPPLEWEVPRAHNIFLHTWAEIGLVGLIVFIILLIHILKTLKQSLYTSASKENYFIKIGLIAAVLSIIIHGLLDTPYYKNDLSIVFVLLLVLIILHSRE